MSNDSDLLVDRKRLKTRLASWQAFAVVAVLVCAFLLAGRFGLSGNSSAIGGDYVAMVRIEGVMHDDPDLLDRLNDVRNDAHAKALVVQLDSPGGTAVSGEELFLQLQKISKTKPVVGVMRTLCASACYMASLGTDHVIARENTLTGSIGVLLQAAEFSRLADKLGITPITIKSGAYKDVPSIGEPFTETQRLVVSELVMDAYDHFVKLIVDRRKMDDAHVRALADGRVYTGSQATKLKLIDGIGGMDDAREWLNTEKKISSSLELREIKPQPEIASLLQTLNQTMGIKIFGQTSVGLDGLISIWHPSLN